MTDKIYLYHYKPLSTLDHFSHLENYMNQKIWFTRLDEFNDPFEAQFYMKNATAQEILNNSAIFDKLYTDIKIKYPTLTEKSLKEELKKPEASILGQRMLYKDFFKSHGAICLTPSSSNIPMWAHYANYHQGYCVEFEIDLRLIYEAYKKGYKQRGDDSDYERTEFDDLWYKVFNSSQDDKEQEILSFNQCEDKHFIFTKVRYKDERPILEAVKMYGMHHKSEYDQNKYISNNSFGVKFKEWAYENEYRLVVNANSKISGLLDLGPYSFIKVSGIIMGYKVKDGFKNVIALLAKRHDIKIYLAECSQEEYKITYNKYV